MPNGRASGSAIGRTRRPTMDDVAARAGVSRTLVSLIFSNKPGAGYETRERVLQAADELGYRPDIAARLLARGRSRTIGVLMDVHQPFQADLVTAIYALAEADGYDVILSASAPGRDEHRAIEALLSHRCEGLILLGPQSDPDYLAALADRAIVAIVGRRLPLAGFDSVHTADEVGIEHAVDYLVELGHRDIAHVDGGTDPGAAERRDAYVADMRRHGLDDRIRIIPGAHDEAAGIAAGRALLRDAALPSAVIAGNDRCAVGLMDTLIRADIKVPQDISIVGFDDTQFSQLSRIDLTTVRQDVDGLAQHAVGLVVRRLEDESLAPTEKVLDPKFVVRGSTARVSSRRSDRLLEHRA